VCDGSPIGMSMPAASTAPARTRSINESSPSTHSIVEGPSVIGAVTTTQPPRQPSTPATLTVRI
jgi:hypothetical protein